jgi:hypothetical protein
MKELSGGRSLAAVRMISIAASIGVIALGACAFGAVAVGAFAIGRLSVKSAKLKSLEIEDLKVKRLHAGEVTVSDLLRLPEIARDAKAKPAAE